MGKKSATLRRLFAGRIPDDESRASVAELVATLGHWCPGHSVNRPTLIPPGPQEVHVWRFGLDLPAAYLAQLERLLTPDERARSARLRLPQHRSRYVAARALMRALLACYLGNQPEEITLACGPNGKPYLAALGTSLEFNLSHSAGQALLAVAQQPVGIDLEVVRGDFDIEAVAASFFAPEEQAALRAVAGPDRNRTFYKMWVRKEAFMKATGRGISETASDFAVVSDAGGFTVRRTLPNLHEEAKPWRIYDLALGLDCAAALAVSGTGTYRIISLDADGE